MGLRTIGIAISSVLAIAGLSRNTRITRHTRIHIEEPDELDEPEQWGRAEPALRRPDNPPRWALDPDIWDRARDTVAKYWTHYDDPWAVVTHVYRRMGGRVG